MNIVQQSIEFRWVTPNALQQIETAARICYKSEDRIGPGTDVEMTKFLLGKKHYPMFDHASMSYRVITDRGVSHEIVRHRLFGFAQESTRYCNYTKGKFGGIQLIQPDGLTEVQCQRRWRLFGEIQRIYEAEIQEGLSPQIARGVLPTALKTELIITGDFTEWRHFFKLRTTKEAHPQMRELAIMILKDATIRIPVVFDEFMVGQCLT